MRRRTVLAAAGTLIGLSGCAATRDELAFSASPGAFADDAVAAAGYEELEREELVETREVDTPDGTKEVTVTNYAQPYRRQVDPGGGEQTLSVAAVVTTPSITLAGQEFNPVGRLRPEELMDRARGRIRSQIDSGEVREVSKVDERSRTVLDQDVTVSVFEAMTKLDGADVTLRAHITRAKHEGDFVLLAGGFPRRVASDEQPRLETLFADVVHPTS